jgi:hypothetical protein
MGECGCGDFQPHKSLKVDESILSVELYDGCQDCETGLMVTLYRFTPDEARDWGITEDDLAQFDDIGMFNIPLMDADDLVEAYNALEAEGDTEPVEEYANLGDWLSDNGLRLLQEALWNRIRKTREEEDKRKGVKG